jgi:DNA-binding IclR family transcriptional regulator
MTVAVSATAPSAAQKALRLIELLGDAPRPLGVSELARKVDGARGTVHKQLAGLVASGWVEQDPDGRYHLTLKAARVGNGALRQAGLGQRIHRVLDTLVERTGECASVAALQDGEAVIVQRVESRQVLHADIRVGTRIALDGGASGLVLAAFALDGEGRDGLRDRGIAVASEELLAVVAADGVAATEDEVVAGISAVSLPLYDALHFKTVALTISAPTARLDVASATDALRDARLEIGRLIGAPTFPPPHRPRSPR